MARKIALTFVVLTVVTCLVLGAAFSSLVSRHLVAGTRERLAEEATLLIRSITEAPVEVRMDRLRRAVVFRVLGATFSSHAVVTDGSLRVMASNDASRFPLHTHLPVEVRGDDVVMVGGTRYIVHGQLMLPDERPQLWLFLFTDYAQVRAARRDTARMLIVSSLLAALAALAVGQVLSTRLLRPLRQLTDGVVRLERREQYRVELGTGDEFEELARAINDLGSSLEFFERNQWAMFQNISHELKTPLASILGYAEGIVDGVFEPAETRTAMVVIAREAQRAKNMIDQLLHLGRVQDPGAEYRETRCELGDILNEARTAVGGLTAERGITLAVQPVQASVTGDPDRLVQAVANLMTNAVRHAASRVDVTSRVEAGRTVITVHDDGPGFAASDLPRLFTRFYRGEGGHTGLGLAIARAIVDRHRGTIAASNHPDGGAVVTVTLPR